MRSTPDHVVLNSDVPRMARLVIRAQKYNEQPFAAEVQSAKRKGIAWNMHVGERSVDVVRRDAGCTAAGRLPSEVRYRFVYRNDADFGRLVRVTKRERDLLVANSGGWAGVADEDNAYNTE